MMSSNNYTKKARGTHVVHKRNEKCADTYACGRKVTETNLQSISWRRVTCKQCLAAQMLSSLELAKLVPFHMLLNLSAFQVWCNEALSTVRTLKFGEIAYTLLVSDKCPTYRTLADLLDANIATRVKAWKLYGKTKKCLRVKQGERHGRRI